MSQREHLQHIRYLACTFMHDRAHAAHVAAELGAAVASLNGLLPDDGRGIAFATATLLFAGCAGMRHYAFDLLELEVRAALRGVGERS